MQTTVVRRIPARAMLVAIVGVAIAWLGAAAIVQTGVRAPDVTQSQRQAWAEAFRQVDRTPWVLELGQARWFSKHGSDAAELAAVNRREWRRVERRMLGDPTVMALVRYRGVTPASLARSYTEHG